CFFFSSRRRHTRWPRDWSSDVCSSDLGTFGGPIQRDKLFFFLSYDAQRNKVTNIVVPNVTPPGGVAGPFGKYLKPYLIGLENNLGLVKGDWNISDRDRLSIRYNLSRYTGLNQESFGSSVA